MNESGYILAIPKPILRRGWGGLFYHLGSTSMVTDYEGNVSQALMYAPFGEVISEYKRGFDNDYITDYLFNGKELDEETGMYYFSARYYDPNGPFFISRDPLEEKYPGISPYAYCLNNPLKYVDPDGRDVFQVDENGNSVGRIKNKHFDQFQVVSVDKDGNKTEITSSEKYKYGTVMRVFGQRSLSKTVTGSDGAKRNANIDFYGIKGNDNAESAFKFFADNTKVEWSKTSFSNGYSVLGTSSLKNTEAAGSYVLDFAKLNGLTIIDHIHNHPSNNPNSSRGDEGFAGRLNNSFPDATTRIYTKNKGKEYYYNEFGPSLKPVIYRDKK